MHRRTHVSLLACLAAAAFHGCAATPPPEPAPEASQPVAAALPEPVEVVPPPPAGVPMDVHSQAITEPASLWTRVRTEGQMNLATGAQLVSIQLVGAAEIEPPLVVLRRPTRWRVTEAIDQDGQPIRFRQDVDGIDARGPVDAREYTEAYLAALRGDAPRRLPIELQLSDLTSRPRIIRKLTVVGNVPAIRRVEERVLEVAAFGETASLEAGVDITVEQPSPLEPDRLQVVARVDPLAPQANRPLIVGAAIADAAGHTAYALAEEGGPAPGVQRFRLDASRVLTPPLRVRLFVATDVGMEQITGVARDIPIP